MNFFRIKKTSIKNNYCNRCPYCRQICGLLFIINGLQTKIVKSIIKQQTKNLNNI